jgi:PIN domain nuclease of toxin-antitoxin system
MKNKTSTTNELGNNANLLLSAVSLAELVIKILDEKAHKGCDEKVWFGFQNGNGEEVGKDIERIIIKAKKFLSNCR